MYPQAYTEKNKGVFIFDQDTAFGIDGRVHQHAEKTIEKWLKSTKDDLYRWDQWMKHNNKQGEMLLNRMIAKALIDNRFTCTKKVSKNGKVITVTIKGSNIKKMVVKMKRTKNHESTWNYGCPCFEYKIQTTYKSGHVSEVQEWVSPPVLGWQGKWFGTGVERTIKMLESAVNRRLR